MHDGCVRIERVDPLAAPDWDASLGPAATFFHSAAWARVLQDAYGFAPHYLVARDGARLQAVLPLVEVDSWLTGRRGISLPFADHCEPLADSDALLLKLFAAAMGRGAARKWDYFELRGGRNRLNAPASVAYHGHTLALTPDTEALFQNTESSVRRAVRKAERSELRIEISHSLESLERFHGLLCLTRRRHGLPPQPLRFFRSLHRHIVSGKKGCTFLAWLGDTPVAGAVFFHFRRTALFKFGASNEDFQHLRANNLLLWRAIEWHARASFETLDLGRTDRDQEGLRRFKLGWGAREHAIEYVRCDCRTGRFVESSDRAHGWHNALFRLMPNPISRLIGAAAYKHVA